jgi:flagellar biosynthetic protein FliP
VSKSKLAAVAFALFAAIGSIALMGSRPASAAPEQTAPPAQPATAPAATTAAPAATAPSADNTQPALPSLPTQPSLPSVATTPAAGSASVNVNLGNALSKPSDSITIIVALTLLSIAPALLMMMTSFTRIVIVLSLTRNALGLQAIPPNQVVVGLALFLSLFVMSPTLSAMNKDAVQPYLHGQMSQGDAYNAGVKPLRTFMLKQTRKSELAMFANASAEKPKTPDDVSMAALVPAFVLSELKTAFIIGFIVFIPFLVIDLIVSSSLMSMGMMMLPPVLVSLPFKILLFVLVDGWALVVKSLITSFH